MKIFKLVHVSKETFTDKESGEMKESSKFTDIGTGFQKNGKESISLKIDFIPTDLKNGFIHLIPKNEKNKF